MYERKYKSDGTISRTQAYEEFEAIHSMAHSYLITSHPEALKFCEQEKSLSLALCTLTAAHFDKLIKEYLKDYPVVF